MAHGGPVLVEEKIVGREVTVGIVDGEALPVVEIRPKTGAYDYTNKYTTGATEYICPAKFDEATTLFKVGELQVEAQPDEHSKFICKKGLASQLEGQTEHARAALRIAEKMAIQLQTDGDSQVNQMIATLQASIDEQA